MEKQKFVDCLEEWFEENRRTFFWREENLTPFQVLLTELLLKRTKASKVDEKAKNLIEKLERPPRAIEVDKSEIKKELRPLGLHNRRAKQIKELSQQIIEEHDGEVPQDREELLNMSGIGPYVADAVRLIAFDKNKIPVDINIARVAREYFDIEPPNDLRRETEISSLWEDFNVEDAEEFLFALIDLGNSLQDSSESSLPDF